jgi:hypothetical protein
VAELERPKIEILDVACFSFQDKKRGIDYNRQEEIEQK